MVIKNSDWLTVVMFNYKFLLASKKIIPYSGNAYFNFSKQFYASIGHYLSLILYKLQANNRQNDAATSALWSYFENQGVLRVFQTQNRPDFEESQKDRMNVLNKSVILIKSCKMFALEPHKNL